MSEWLFELVDSDDGMEWESLAALSQSMLTRAAVDVIAGLSDVESQRVGDTEKCRGRAWNLRSTHRRMSVSPTSTWM